MNHEIKGSSSTLVTDDRLHKDDVVMLQIWANHNLQGMWVGSRASLIRAIWPEGVEALTDLFFTRNPPELSAVKALKALALVGQKDR